MSRASSAFAASGKDAWTPAAAEAVQRETARDAAKSAADPREREARLRALHRRETGFGSTHAPYPDPKNDPVAQGERLRLQHLQQRIAEAMRGKRERDAFEKTMPAAKGGVSMTLRTAEGVLDSGGYLYAWDLEDNYIGYVWIDAGGVVMLPGAAGDTLELLVFPNGPFAVQSVETTLAAGGDVLLRSARAVPLAIDTDDGSAFAGTLDVTLFSASEMADYAQACGYALARSQAKAGDPALIAGYIGKGDTFDAAISRHAFAYADQNEADYAALKKAVKTGAVKAVVLEPGED